ncbi:MAG: hypothetical protein OXH65_11375 [Paracoccaceae bacterium]|nr:hypothetical protein [Paracoccaceae bacterium]MDE2675697.1 hypothetical protein [Paracoccaceae bacterium]MDE2738636.1 hypothetical protein [Paracoccaceae bacterium]MXZ50613.1 hypothetical protein [Paracoccaceae bacterium]
MAPPTKTGRRSNLIPNLLTGRVMELCIEDFGDRVAIMRHLLQGPKTQTLFREEMFRFSPLDVIIRVLDRPDYMSHVIRTVNG